MVTDEPRAKRLPFFAGIAPKFSHAHHVGCFFFVRVQTGHLTAEI